MLGLAFFFSSIGSADASGAKETQMSISPHAMLKETASKNIPDCGTVPGHAEKVPGTVTFNKLTADKECTCRKTGDYSGNQTCVKGQDICLRSTGECGTAIQILTSDPNEKDISVIVEEAQQHFTIESHGFQRFPNAFPQYAMEELNKKVRNSNGKVTEKMLEEVWPSVKEELMKKMHKPTCRARLGAPADAVCAQQTDMGTCEDDPMCYKNKLVDFQFLNKHLAEEVSKSPSGSEYIEDFRLKYSGDIDDLYKIRGLYRRARVPKPETHGFSLPTYKTNDIKNSSGYESVSENDPDLKSKREKYQLDVEEIQGLFYLHIDTKADPTIQLIQDSGKHVLYHKQVEEVKDTEEAKREIALVPTVVNEGYVGELYNFWAPVIRPDEEAPQKYGDSIDTCPLVFQNNANLGKVYMAATKIGTVDGWKTGFQMHGAMAVFQKNGDNLRTSAEFRVFELLEKPQALYEGKDFDCAKLKKEDCKPEATKSKCAWDAISFDSFMDGSRDLNDETCTNK